VCGCVDLPMCEYVRPFMLYVAPTFRARWCCGLVHAWGMGPANCTFIHPRHQIHMKHKYRHVAPQHPSTHTHETVPPRTVAPQHPSTHTHETVPPRTVAPQHPSVHCCSVRTILGKQVRRGASTWRSSKCGLNLYRQTSSRP